MLPSSLSALVGHVEMQGSLPRRLLYRPRSHLGCRPGTETKRYGVRRKPHHSLYLHPVVTQSRFLNSSTDTSHIRSSRRRSLRCTGNPRDLWPPHLFWSCSGSCIAGQIQGSSSPGSASQSSIGPKPSTIQRELPGNSSEATPSSPQASQPLLGAGTLPASHSQSSSEEAPRVGQGIQSQGCLSAPKR